MLTSTSAVPSTSLSGSRAPSPTIDIVDDNPNRLTTYLHQLAGYYEMEVDVVTKDHCYARPWNWKPENVYVKPIKKLFFPKKTSAQDKHIQDEEVDVECNSSEPCSLPFDLSKARHLMDELQRLVNFVRPDENDDWEERIDKLLWSPVQNRIFSKVLKILNSERLARLAKANSPIEPIFRRTSVDTAARRFRETLASAGWDWRLTQWLHSLLFENLPQEYLGIYLDILQTLRLKIPQLIDKMIAVQPNITAKAGSITWETLGSLLKRTWDPIAPSLNTNRLKKLPGNPILIIAPSGVSSTVTPRQHKWISHLGSLGMVVTVHTHLGIAANRMTMMVCIDQLVQATRTKIQDIRSDCPGRPIILVGFNTGAALACQVAQMEHVTAVVCLGFPYATAEGKRGTPDDTLMDIRCPVMFVIGQNATLVRPDDLEEIREKMLVETSLVVVGTADDYLRISTAKKLSDGITQSMVDRCILDEIGDFVGSILLQPHPLPLRSTSVSSYENKNRKDHRKRRNSTSSSVESEPNSPTVKKSRPNTPVSAIASVGLNSITNPSTTTKIGTFNTQPSVVSMSGHQVNSASTIKRKSRILTSQKAQFVEHLIASRIPGQQTSTSENGGITLNIGSLASLAPIGPIRLAPAHASQSGTNATKSSIKTTVPVTKVPKIIPTNVPLQNVPKMKAIMSTNKNFSKVISGNYRHVSVSDKAGEPKLVNVFPTGNQIRVNTSTTAGLHKSNMVQASGTLTNLLQNGKNPVILTSGSSSARVATASSILLTPNNSVANSVTPTTSTISKVMDSMASTSSSSHVMLSSTHSLETSKISQLSRQITMANNNTDDNHQIASGGNKLMIENSVTAKATTSSVIVPFSSHGSGTILPLSNKLKPAHKMMKTMPKITVNTSNLQRIHKAKPVQKKILTNDVDDELGNILDIPIIFAKDDDNLNVIEKTQSITQASTSVEVQEKNIPKVTGSTKVVLISNKHDKLQQTANKLVTPTQTIICPNMSVQNLNQVILHARAQNSAISAKGRTAIPIQARGNQPGIKYTKIILAKRTPQTSHQTEKNEQVIVTKTIDKMHAPKLLTFEKNEHRYAQTSAKLLTKSEARLVDGVLEIEDAIKTNIIERKYVPVPEIDLTSPKKNDNSKLHSNEQNNSQCDGN